MKRLLKYVLPPAVILGALVVVVIAAMNREPPERREPPRMAMLVDTIEATASDGRFTVETQGTVRARTRTSLVAEVSGRIVSLSDNFVAGGFFEAGEELARIDPSDYETALLEAEAELASARARLSDEQARSDQARQDWQRLQGNERQPNELVLRLPQLADAKAGVQAAEAAVLRARRNLERTRIRLPFDGLVRERGVDLGQYVNAGGVLGEAFGVAEAEIRLPLSDRDLAFLDLPRPGYRPEEPVPVTLSGSVNGRQGTWQAEIVRTEATVDENTRLTHAVARVNDPYGLLEGSRELPLQMGTFVNARIEGRASEGLIALPRVALRQSNQVYIADAEDRLEVRQVEVIRSTPESVYVRNSLEPGDRVVTTAIQAPVPGLALRVRDDAADPAAGPDELESAGEYAARDEGETSVEEAP